MKLMSEWFRTGFEEAPGQASPIRIQTFAVAMLCIAAPAILELELSAFAGRWVEIPATVSLFFTGCFAAATGAHLYQYNHEGEAPPKTPAP